MKIDLNINYIIDLIGMKRENIKESIIRINKNKEYIGENNWILGYLEITPRISVNILSYKIFRGKEEIIERLKRISIRSSKNYNKLICREIIRIEEDKERYEKIIGKCEKSERLSIELLISDNIGRKIKEPYRGRLIRGSCRKGNKYIGDLVGMGIIRGGDEYWEELKEKGYILE